MRRLLRLDLEATRSSATTSTLELAALGQDARSLALVGAHAEVADGLTGVAGTTEDQSVLTSGGATSKLVEGDALTAGLDNAGTGGLGETESGNGSLGDLEEAVVISDGADNDDGLVLSTLLEESTRDAGNRNRRAVDLREEERTKDDLVELRVGTTSEEAVKLDKKLQVDIVRLRGRAVAGALVLLSEQILSHGERWYFVNVDGREVRFPNQESFGNS